MKKTTITYISAFILSILVLLGGYVITSFVVKTYTILQEENQWNEVSIVAKDAAKEDISRALMSQWLEIFKQREYVSAIESYIIHDLAVEEEHDSHFIFSSTYSVATNDPETNWKNWPHSERNGLFTFDHKFRVNKVGDTYYFRPMIEEKDAKLAK